MPSDRFMQMQTGVTTLRRFMLPSKFSSTGTYPERVHQRTAAFRLLVHAEFESYLEDVVTAHLQARLRDWQINRKPSSTIASIIAYDETAGKKPTSLLAPPQKPAAQFDDRLRDAANRFNSRVRVLNHGIREKNVLALLLPVGFDSLRIDTVWLADLDAWADERGVLAHQSPGKLKTRLDPAREYSRVKRLMAGFRALDGEILRIP